MPRDFIDKEDNYNEKDYRVVMGRFSSSLRGKAIILFLIYFVILALYFLMNIYVYFPHVSNDYEKVVSKNHIRRIIENLNYKLNIRMVKMKTKTKTKKDFTFLTSFFSFTRFLFNLWLFHRLSQAK